MRAILPIFTFLFIAHSAFTQPPAIIGAWKGPSLCQVKNSPCHDEMAVYHADTTSDKNRYRFMMNKLVDGKEEEMGVLYFNYTPASNELICRDTAHNGVWQFHVTGNTMEGTAYFKGVLYRVIKLKKQ